jgi:dTDP-4-dehydro-6-deoxy-alpha-D-glucopyranose 2,3-dehydratase
MNLTAFRALLDRSRPGEPTSIAPILAWLEEARRATSFRSELIPLREVRGWSADAATGNIVHASGEFFSIEGARSRAGTLREVSEWDQPIYNQKEGGILGILTEVGPDGLVRFLLHGKVEPGNIGNVQLCPSLQATMSNLRRAHGGRRPALADYFLDDSLTEVVYRAQHNEEGGRFWRKSNANELRLLRAAHTFAATEYIWVTLGQAKALMLEDNLVSPFVKTILAPL